MITRSLRALLVKYRSQIAVISLIVSMYIMAGITLESDMIFPEVGALAVGAWILSDSLWAETPLYLWLSPSLAAITGVALVHFVQYPPEILIVLAFVLVLVQLLVLRSNVLPSFSAAILPILLNTDSIYYLVSVFLFTGVIAIGRMLWESRRSDVVPRESATRSVGNVPGRREGPGVAYWMKVSVVVALVAAVALQTDWIYIISPPLIVTFVEFTQAGHVRADGRPLSLGLLLLLAALSGAVWVAAVSDWLHWPLCVSAIGVVICVLLLYRRFDMVFVPAVALSLLPSIIYHQSLVLYPLQVAIGIILFIGAGCLLFESQSLWRRFFGRGGEEGGPKEIGTSETRGSASDDSK